MKRFFVMFFALCLALVQLPAFGAETNPTSDKDLCLLYSRNCANQALTLQEKIARLKQEIAKGTYVYSAKELQRLENKLEEAEAMLNDLLYGPSRGGHGRGRW